MTIAIIPFLAALIGLLVWRLLAKKDPIIADAGRWTFIFGVALALYSTLDQRHHFF